MNKQEALERLNETDQAFLRSVAGIFGRPSAIAIRFRDGSRYDDGRFMSAQDYPDYRSRVEKSGAVRPLRG